MINCRKKLLSLSLCSAVLFTSLFVFNSFPIITQAATLSTIYVSTTGNDSNPGTISQPLLSISKARDVVRTINSNMSGDIIVYLRGGTYALDSTIQLNAQDSGTNGYNVIYTSYPGETANISGGVNVSGWSLYDSSRNIYRAYVGTSFYSRDLYINGERAPRAQSEVNPSGFSLDTYNGFYLPSSGTYANRANGCSMASQNSYSTQGDNVIQKTEDDTINQQWTPISLGNGYYKIANASGYVLTPENHSTADGASLMQWPYEGNNDQMYSLTATSGGYYKLVNRATNFLVAPSNNSSASGTELIVYHDQNNPVQEWKFKTTNGITANMASWGNVSDVEIHQYAAWTEQWGKVDHISNGTIYMAQPFWNITRSNAAYYIGMSYPQVIENAYELLNTAGQWYLNRTDGYLYYIPTTGQNLSSTSFVLAKLEKLVDGNSNGSITSKLTNVQFKGIDFEYTTWFRPSSNIGRAAHQAGVVFDESNAEGVTISALDFNYSNNILIDTCTIKNIGATAVGFKLGGQNNTIYNCIITEIACNGISIGDIKENDHTPSDARYIVSNNKIIKNTIFNIGTEMHDSVGIFGGYVYALTIDHNYLYNMPYSAISVGWGWGGQDYSWEYNPNTVGNNKITYNKIDNYMNVLYDGGGIYTLGRQDNSQIQYNYIKAQHNDFAYIYLDNGTQGYKVSNNIVDNTNGSNCNNWLLANDAGGGSEGQSTHNNVIKYNYYKAGMIVYKCPSTNTIEYNTAVSGSWDGIAQNIIDCTGVSGTTIAGITVNRANGCYMASQNSYLNKNDNVIQKTVDLTNNQQWIAKSLGNGYYIIVNSEGYVLTPASHSTADGASLTQWSYEGNYDQMYTLTATSGGYYKLVNIATGYLVTPSGNSSASGTQLIAYHDQNNQDQEWTFGNTIAGITANRANGCCIASQDSYLSQGDNILQNTADGTIDQQWTAISLNNGYYKIVNADGYVLTPASHSTADGAALTQWSYEGNYDQMYTLTATSGGYYKLENRATGYLVTPSGNSSASGTQLIAYHDQTNQNQEWIFR